MRRFELEDEEKFWEVWTDPDKLVVYYRFGKVGTQGQTKLKKVADLAAATKEEDRLVAEKEKQGYSLVSSGAAPKKTKPNPALEKAILDDPDASDAYQVYGDWLTEQGDPLGELVAIQVALAKKPADKKLRAKDEELRKTHARTLLGELADAEGDEFDATFRYGFLHRVAIGGEEYCELDGPETFAQLRALPSARFLHQLDIRMFDDEDGQPSYADILKAMVKLGLPATLRKLSFDVGGYQVSWTDLGDLSKLYPMLEKLTELWLHVGKMKLGTMTLPNLERLEIKTGGLTKGNLASITEASWPKLSSLVLYFGDEEYGGNCKAKDLEPIFKGSAFPKVTTLGLCNAKFEDEIAQAIPRAPILKQISVLDLSKGTMGDEGAQALLDAAPALAHLTRLDLSENYISDAMAKKLKAAFGKSVEVSDQGDEEEAEDRYVQVAE